METYITICKRESQREFAIWFRELKQGLCVQSRRVGWAGGWEGGLGGRGHGCIYGWFLLMYDRRPQSSIKQIPFNLKKWGKKPICGFLEKGSRDKWVPYSKTHKLIWIFSFHSDQPGGQGQSCRKRASSILVTNSAASLSHGLVEDKEMIRRQGRWITCHTDAHLDTLLCCQALQLAHRGHSHQWSGSNLRKDKDLAGMVSMLHDRRCSAGEPCGDLEVWWTVAAQQQMEEAKANVGPLLLPDDGAPGRF